MLKAFTVVEKLALTLVNYPLMFANMLSISADLKNLLKLQSDKSPKRL